MMMEYYLAMKRSESESSLMRWMNLEPIIQSKGSKKEKEISHINVHTQNLEGQALTVLCAEQQSRLRQEGQILDTVGEGGGRMISENSHEICTLP